MILHSVVEITFPCPHDFGIATSRSCLFFLEQYTITALGKNLHSMETSAGPAKHQGSKEMGGSWCQDGFTFLFQ